MKMPIKNLFHNNKKKQTEDIDIQQVKELKTIPLDLNLNGNGNGNANANNMLEVIKEEVKSSEFYDNSHEETKKEIVYDDKEEAEEEEEVKEHEKKEIDVGVDVDVNVNVDDINLIVDKKEEEKEEEVIENNIDDNQKNNNESFVTTLPNVEESRTLGGLEELYNNFESYTQLASRIYQQYELDYDITTNLNNNNNNNNNNNKNVTVHEIQNSIEGFLMKRHPILRVRTTKPSFWNSIVRISKKQQFLVQEYGNGHGNVDGEKVCPKPIITMEKSSTTLQDIIHREFHVNPSFHVDSLLRYSFHLILANDDENDDENENNDDKKKNMIVKSIVFICSHCLVDGLGMALLVQDMLEYIEMKRQYSSFLLKSSVEEVPEEIIPEEILPKPYKLLPSLDFYLKGGKGKGKEKEMSKFELALQKYPASYRGDNESDSENMCESVNMDSGFAKTRNKWFSFSNNNNNDNDKKKKKKQEKKTTKVVKPKSQISIFGLPRRLIRDSTIGFMTFGNVHDVRRKNKTNTNTKKNKDGENQPSSSTPQEGLKGSSYEVFTIEKELFKKLYSKAKKERVTINSALGAAILLSYKDLLDHTNTNIRFIQKFKNNNKYIRNHSKIKMMIEVPLSCRDKIPRAMEEKLVGLHIVCADIPFFLKNDDLRDQIKNKVCSHRYWKIARYYAEKVNRYHAPEKIAKFNGWMNFAMHPYYLLNKKILGKGYMKQILMSNPGRCDFMNERLKDLKVKRIVGGISQEESIHNLFLYITAFDSQVTCTVTFNDSIISRESVQYFVNQLHEHVLTSVQEHEIHEEHEHESETKSKSEPGSKKENRNNYVTQLS